MAKSDQIGNEEPMHLEETLAMKFRKSFIPIKNDPRFEAIIK